MKRIIAFVTVFTLLISLLVFPKISYAEEVITENTNEDLSVYYYEDFNTGYEGNETKPKSISASGCDRVMYKGEYAMKLSGTPGEYTIINLTKSVEVPEIPRLVLEYKVQGKLYGGSNVVGFTETAGMPSVYLYDGVKLTFEDTDNIAETNLEAGTTVTVVYNNEKAERDIYIDGKYAGTYDSSNNALYKTYLKDGMATFHWYNYVHGQTELYYKYIKVYKAPSDYSPETFMPQMYGNLGKENVFLSSDAAEEAEYYGLLKGLGIWNTIDVGEYQLNEKLTRLQFASLLSKAIKVEPLKKPVGVYKDIALRHYMAGTLDALYNLNIMKGVAAEEFAPDRGVNVYDAATALVRALGYDTLAQYKGGYVTGYADIAKKINLLKGINTSADYEITHKDAARLFCNFLNSEVFQMKAMSSDGTVEMTEVEGETVLKIYHNIIGIKGIMTSNDATSLTTGIDGDDGSVTIGGEKLRAADKSANKFLGYEVEAYYDAETKLLLYCFATPNNKTLSVSSDDFGSYSDGSIKYYVGNNAKTVRLSVDTDTIYNGRATYLSKGLFEDFNEGKIEFVDNNRDGIYDVVLISSYVNRIIDKKISENKVITFKDNGAALFLERDYDNYKIVDAKEKEIAFDSIPLSAVASVMESKDGEYCVVYISSNSIVGEVDAVNQKTETITIAGEEYDASKKFFEDYPNVKTGIVGEFLMNVFGKVVAYSEYNSLDKGLAYLIAIGPCKKVFNDTVQIKVYTDSNKLAIFETNEKVKLDGHSVEATNLLGNSELIAGGQTVGQLIGYELNDSGKLIAIDTKRFDSEKEDSRNTIHFVREGELNYAGIDRRFDTDYMNSNAKVFEIPEDIYDADAEDFSCGLGSFDDDSNNYVMLYKLNEETLGIDVVVTIQKEGIAKIDSYTRACLVSEVETVWDEKEEKTIKVIRYWQGGIEKTVRVAKDSMITGLAYGETTADVSAGDVVVLVKNSKDELKSLKLLVDYENPTAQAAEERGNIHRGVYATVYEMRDNLAYITTDNIAEVEEELLTLELHRIPTVYVYYGDRNIVTLGSEADVLDFKTAGSDASRIVFYETRGIDYDLIIYK